MGLQSNKQLIHEVSVKISHDSFFSIREGLCELLHVIFTYVPWLMALKNKCRKKTHKNHLRRNNYEVCTAVVLCFPNILEVMVLENLNLSYDKLG
jgi:hypothetical protein